MIRMRATPPVYQTVSSAQIVVPRMCSSTLVGILILNATISGQTGGHGLGTSVRTLLYIVLNTLQQPPKSLHLLQNNNNKTLTHTFAESLDREVASSFRWKLIQPALCIAVHAVLLLVTAWYVKEFWRDVGENGYGELLSLKEVTARQLRDQPILSFVLTLAFGEDIVEHPVRMDIELGHISKVRHGGPATSGFLQSSLSTFLA
eukprot:SAG31_NODE_1309_length_8877_cov_5.662452_4_plen_204_part_00